ncbi:hypothetical protein ACH5RR_017316 [Cinchona calisaya]|uniref:Uncharacterized protein n=1 Tax=Cinchona calisaya TaxID=153742 RepID=A0ABD3A133_9GENT
MLRKKGGKIRRNYCKQYAGHNKTNCPLKVRENELKGAENQVKHADAVEQSISVGYIIEGTVAEQTEGAAREQVEKKTRQQVDEALINQMYEGKIVDESTNGDKKAKVQTQTTTFDVNRGPFINSSTCSKVTHGPSVNSSTFSQGQRYVSLSSLQATAGHVFNSLGTGSVDLHDDVTQVVNNKRSPPGK